MNDIKLTAARANLLRAIAAGKVIHHISMRLDRPERNTWDGRLVTPAVRYLDQAGLVTYRMGSGRFSAPWQLTEAGQRWLANNAEGASR